MANFTVTRNYGVNETLGVMSGDFSCKTLELPWVENISHISCIPEGTYDYEVRPSPHLKRDVLFLDNKETEPRSNVELHNGSTRLDILGCCLVGRDFTTFNIDGVDYPGVNMSKLTLEQLVKVARPNGKITFTSNKGK